TFSVAQDLLPPPCLASRSPCGYRSSSQKRMRHVATYPRAKPGRSSLVGQASAVGSAPGILFSANSHRGNPMPSYTHAHRPTKVITPLGPDVLLLQAFQTREGLSELFSFRLDLLALHRSPVAFDRLIGQSVTVELNLPDRGRRHFNGVVKQFTQ